jgi:hypothetical protein
MRLWKITSYYRSLSYGTKIAIFRLREVAKEKWGDRCKAPTLTPTKRGMTTGGKEDDDGLADTLFKDGETHFQCVWILHLQGKRYCAAYRLSAPVESCWLPLAFAALRQLSGNGINMVKTWLVPFVLIRRGLSHSRLHMLAKITRR